MRRGANSTVWVLAITALIVGVIGFEVVRAQMSGTALPSARVLAKPYDPDFKVGEFAPDFTLKDRSGKPRTLAELLTKESLLFFTCGCDACDKLMTYVGTLVKKMGPRALPVVNVTTMPSEAEAAWIRRTELPQAIVYEKKNGRVMEAYRGHPCPRVFRLAADRKVLWMSPSMGQLQNPPEMGDIVGAQLGFPPAGYR